MLFRGAGVGKMGVVIVVSAVSLEVVEPKVLLVVVLMVRIYAQECHSEKQYGMGTVVVFESREGGGEGILSKKGRCDLFMSFLFHVYFLFLL